MSCCELGKVTSPDGWAGQLLEGPPKIPVEVGSRFWPIHGLMGGPKSSQIGVPWVDLVPDIPQKGK